MIGYLSAGIFKNCEFSNNQAKKYGGAIYTVIADITAEGCKFSNNSASGDPKIFKRDMPGGGAVWVDGTRHDNRDGYAIFKNTTFEKNSIRSSKSTERAGGGGLLSTSMPGIMPK
ncbi:MAG: hypothetical protein HC880_06005 [Bacteroidia bacterium]|nr:hypothetical protein [Bacteroidia bacterium]